MVAALPGFGDCFGRGDTQTAEYEGLIVSSKVTSLTFELFGRDKTASKALKAVGDQAGLVGDSFSRAGAAIGAGIAIAAAAAVAFGVQSVRAFAEAEEAQNKLAFAFEKFPALADTSIEALGKLNTALMKKTRFDDDAIASGQSVLAQFGLTGSQLKKLTPLMLDFAARTGKTLPDAAADLGKALLGQGRALKEVGFDFNDTGNLASNFDQLMQGLSTTVGGFAEKDAQTAGGKLEMLRNRFGEVQEVVGAALMPALGLLLDWFEGPGMAAVEGFAAWFKDDGLAAFKGFTSWITDEGLPIIGGFVDGIAQLAQDGTLVPTVVGGLFAITGAQIGLNAAMAANPIGLVVLALAILATQFTIAMANLDAFKLSASNTGWGQALLLMFTGWFGIVAAFAQNWDVVWFTMVAGFSGQVNAMITIINGLLSPLQAVLSVINSIAGTNFNIRIAPLGFPTMNQSAGAPTGRTGGRGTAAPRGRGMVGLAAGGIVPATPGGIPAIVGEGAYDELVLPINRRNMAMLGGSGSVTVVINGSVLSDERKIAVAVRDALKNQRGQGLSTQGAFV